ncbi:putative nuclear matrix constituent protein 1-like protein [Platanthera guangdongensis]|uniref:Nuclear matrix constituent protein 1-like protein n=1 Tax=Platanthera guangdongensis TaxID=2320717 RepID=A0ABR2N1D1_9ASPA
MFTPQKKGWAGWGGQENGSSSRKTPGTSLGVVLGRGKGVAGAEENLLPPPQGLLGEKDGGMSGVGGSSSDDWKRFRESGLLDEKVQLRRDKQVLSDEVSGLQIELEQCLYTMGLLLIEKKQWSLQIEELEKTLVEAQEILKREQTAHVIAVAELEKREENLKKALGLEKQCVVDLEKALHEMRAEVSETKFISEKTLANAHALETSLEEKQLEIELKLRTADAKFAEADRKNSEIGRKLEDLEGREHKVQRELSSLNAERKALENSLSKQQEHLQEWEKELQENQRRLLDEQRLLNEKEARINDLDMILKKKEAETEKARKKIDATSTTLKSQEDDFKERQRALTVSAKAVESKSSNLEKKERDLMAIEEKLNAREREELQKLLDEHKAILDAKKNDFEAELAMKKRSLDEEVKNHMDILDEEKSLARVKKEQLLKREKSLEIEVAELKNKEKDLESKSKALRNWEDSLKGEEKLLQEEKKQLLGESNKVEASRVKLHDEKVAIEAEVQKIIFEKENLKLTQEERTLHLKLQTELKLEKSEYQMMMESLEKQKEALRQEKEMFERDWEVLDEKRVAFEADKKKLSAERENFEKWRQNEEERLRRQGLESRADIQRELEDLRLKKETFEKMMEHERSGSHAEVDRERADMSREFELLMHKLEMNMQRKQDDVEKQFQEKKIEFESWREVELCRINSLNESNDFKLSRMEMEQNHLLREKEDFSDQRLKIEVDRLEIQKDIDNLFRLSKNLKDQRMEFAKEKKMFLLAAEKWKTCHNCGVPISNFDLLDFQPLGSTEDSEGLLPNLTDGFLEEHLKGGSTCISNGGPVAGSTDSSSHMKHWLQRCANLFKISPKKDMHPPTEDQTETSFDERLDIVASEDAACEPAPSSSFENQMVNVDTGGVVTGEVDRVNNAEDGTEASFGVARSSADVVWIHLNNSTKKTVAVTDDESNEMKGSSMHPENDSQLAPSKQRLRRQPSRKAKSKPIHRTHSVKAVVEEAKAILGQDSESKIVEQQNNSAEVFQTNSDKNQNAQVKQVLTRKGRKRRLREVEPEYSEPHSESLSIGERLKKRQTSSQSAAHDDKRYNLRRSTVANKTASSKETLHKKGEDNAGSLQLLPESNITAGGQLGSNSEKGSLDAERSTYHDQVCGALANSENLLQKSAVQSIVEVQSEKIVQYERREANKNSVIVNSIDLIKQNAKNVDEAEGDDDHIIKSSELSEQIAVVEYPVDADAQEDAAGAPPDSGSASPDDLENDDGEEEDSDEDSKQQQQQHTASVGKKLWKFFTS